MKADVKKNVSSDTSEMSLHEENSFSLSFKRTRSKEKIQVCLETNSGIVILPMHEIRKTMSNGKIVVHGKSF
jgi:hypothetical protein